MTHSRSALGPTVMTALSVVVLLQSAVLGWIILAAPDRARILNELRTRPVETVIAACTAPLSQ